MTELHKFPKYGRDPGTPGKPAVRPPLTTVLDKNCTVQQGRYSWPLQNSHNQSVKKLSTAHTKRTELARLSS